MQILLELDTHRPDQTAGKNVLENTAAEFCYIIVGELLPEQKRAAKAMLAHDTGVLAATTAFGKTVVELRG